ncbi:MAG: PQQ-dependent sugar dehydrogenase [Deltaproteobacteria bacterium]|nr:PQQ-dependent sugar dehydrogenase [Deltaproteobacteria bacterium]
MTTKIALLALGLIAAGCPNGQPSSDGGSSGSTSTDPGTTGTTGTPPQPDTGDTAPDPDTTQGTSTSSSSGDPDSTGGTTSGNSSSGDPSTSGDSSGEEESSDSSGNMGACPYNEVMGMPDVQLQLVGEGFDRPVLALGHPTEPDRLFVVEQGGDVRILEPGQNMAPAAAFLSVAVLGANNNSIGAEFGLLGFAFHPDFPVDPRVYVNYNPSTGALRTVVSEFTLNPANPDQVDPASERIIVELEQPAGNHNGGMIEFGPDDYLYIGMGDGGGGGDTFETGRNPAVLHAKMLRIGVEPDGNPDNPQACVGCSQLGPFDYTIPADNPFVGVAGFAPEIYAWGLRNPWRFSHDPATGWLYAADVGQNAWEEVSIVGAGTDQGWSDMEGFHCFGGANCDIGAPAGQVNVDGMTMPIAEYNHAGGRCSITGAAVYHSCEVPAWDGIYFYSDFCSGQVFGLIWDGVNVNPLGELFDSNELPLGFGHNAHGDVFITTVDAILGGPIFDGLVYRVAPAP